MGSAAPKHIAVNRVHRPANPEKPPPSWEVKRRSRDQQLPEDTQPVSGRTRVQAYLTPFKSSPHTQNLGCLQSTLHARGSSAHRTEKQSKFKAEIQTEAIGVTAKLLRIFSKRPQNPTWAHAQDPEMRTTTVHLVLVVIEVVERTPRHQSTVTCLPICYSH